jgi:uncharacterized coiled-coil DUF342 family protein
MTKMQIDELKVEADELREQYESLKQKAAWAYGEWRAARAELAYQRKQLKAAPR